MPVPPREPFASSRPSPPKASEGDGFRETLPGAVFSKLGEVCQSVEKLASFLYEHVLDCRRTATIIRPAPIVSYILSSFRKTNESDVISTKYLFPCPLPFAWRCTRPVGSRRTQTRWGYRRSIEILVNFIVAALSHVAIGFRSFCPDEGLHGGTLSYAQSEFVEIATNHVRSMGRLLRATRAEGCGLALGK